MKRSLLLAGLLAGCVKPDQITCGDLICPTNSVCVPEENTCVDVATLAIPSSDIELMDVPCGHPATQELALRNFGTAPISYRATSSAPGVTLDPAEAEVEPGETVTLLVVADPSSVGMPGRIITGNITIETDVATVSRRVRTSAAGAVPVLVDSFNFGETNQNVPVDKTLSLRNDGTMPVDIAITGLSSPFSVNGDTAITLGPGASGHFTATFAPPALTEYHSTATLTYTGNVCESPPTSIDASGTATGSPLLLGESPVKFSPSVACGAQSATHELALTNNLAVDAPVALSFASTDTNPFFTTTESIVIPAASTVAVNIDRRSTKEVETVGSHTATLTLQMTTPSSIVTRMVSVEQLVSAPVLTLSANTVALDSTAAVAGSLTLLNTGNRDADIKIEPASGIVGSYVVSVSPAAFALKQGLSQVLTFRAEQRAGAPKAAEMFHTRISAPGACASSLDITASVGVH